MSNTAVDRKTEVRKSGNLSLFLATAVSQSAPPEPHSRFRVCRGFIDDLNRVLPIRLRIQLEGEITRGALTGAFQAGQARSRWDFQPSA